MAIKEITDIYDSYAVASSSEGLCACVCDFLCVFLYYNQM